MRIGSPSKPIVVAQPRVRPAETSDSLAKAVPKYPVGRVAAYVEQINNRSFGNADTRAFRSSAKPAALAGRPAKASAPVVRAAPSTGRMPSLTPLRSPGLVLALTGVLNRGGEGNQTSSRVDLDTLSALEPSRESVGQLAVAIHPSIVGEWKDVPSVPLPGAPEPQADLQSSDSSDVRAASAVARPRFVKRADIASRLPQTTSLPSRFQRRGQALQPVAARPLQPQHDAELPPRLKEVHLLALLPEAQSLSPLSPDASLDRLDRAGMTYVCFDSDDEGFGGCDTDWDSESESGGDSDMDADADLGYSASRIRTIQTVGTSDYRWDENEQLRQDVVRYRTELEACDELPDATKISLATRLSSVESIMVDGGVADKDQGRKEFLDSIEKFNRTTLRSVKADEAVTAVDDSRDEASLNDALIRAFVQQRRQESLYAESSSDSDSGSDSDSDLD